MEFKYQLGEKTYIQKKLVLGQHLQLTRIFKSLDVPTSFDVASLLLTIGDHLPVALAVVLTEEGQSLKDKDLDALGREISFSIAPEQTMEVVRDFFVCNPIASLLSDISEAVGEINKRLLEARPSSLSSAPSPAVT